MLPLPNEHDANEWLLLAIFAGSLLLVRLPKRFPTSMTFLIMLFGSFFARVLDHLFAAPPLDLYDVMDQGAYELYDVFTYFMFAPFAYLFVYLYDRWRIQHLSAIGYILAWSLLGTGVEWIASLFGIYTYKEWKIAYSFPVYLIVQFSTLLFFHYVRRLYFTKQDRSHLKTP